RTSPALKLGYCLGSCDQRQKYRRCNRSCRTERPDERFPNKSLRCPGINESLRNDRRLCRNRGRTAHSSRKLRLLERSKTVDVESRSGNGYSGNRILADTEPLPFQLCRLSTLFSKVSVCRASRRSTALPTGTQFTVIT